MPSSSPNEPIRTRFTPEEKTEFMATAEDYGSNASAIIRQLVAVWMGKPGARMPDGPWSYTGDPRREARASG